MNETAWTHGEPRRTVLGLEGGAVIRGLGLIARVGHGAQAPSTGYSKTAVGGGILIGAGANLPMPMHDQRIRRSVVNRPFEPITLIGQNARRAFGIRGAKNLGGTALDLQRTAADREQRRRLAYRGRERRDQRKSPGPCK